MIRHIVNLAVLTGAAALLFTGCASTGRRIAMPQPRMLGAHYPTPEHGIEGRIAEASTNLPCGAVTLDAALRAALLNNPALAALSIDIRIAEAQMFQARALPNPEVELELEEYDRDGTGFDSVETAVGLAQVIELGGKRRWRTRVAAAQGELSGWDYESKRLEILTETAKRYMAVIAAQRRLALAQSLVQLAERTSNAVTERVKAGKEPPLQASKSEAELALVRMEALSEQNALRTACTRLAAMWGDTHVRFDTVEGHMAPPLEDIPDLASLQPFLAKNPALARLDSERRLRQAELSEQRAAGIPDLTAAAAFHQYEEDGTDALAFGVGIPLPLFDRNRGHVAAAALVLARLDAEHRAAELALATELAEIHAGLTTAWQQVQVLQAQVLPAMEQAFTTAREGYTQGKFSYLDMLDAQRGLFEAKASAVTALHDYHNAIADIQRITGTSINALMPELQEE